MKHQALEKSGNPDVVSPRCLAGEELLSDLSLIEVLTGVSIVGDEPLETGLCSPIATLVRSR
jgi:hypothetical protein